VRAETLVHARLLAAADKMARVYVFDAGFRVDPEFEQMIPDELIGRALARDEATELQRRLRGGRVFARSLITGNGRHSATPTEHPSGDLECVGSVNRWLGGCLPAVAGYDRTEWPPRISKILFASVRSQFFK
jgi:hypothetical protein